MQLPPKLEEAIETAYIQMLHEPHHSLVVKQRLPIYQAMTESNPEIGRKARGWLAFLAAQKVLPIWEKESPSNDSRRINLELTKDLLTGKLFLEELKENYETTLMFLGGGLGQHGWDYSSEANYAFFAPDLALAEAMGDFLYKRDPISLIDIIEQRDIEQGFPDEMMIALNVDTASVAVCAYSGISFDWDALDKMGFNSNDHSSEILTHVANTFHPNFKPAKRKEFWDWWLGEAIPQAWKLAIGSTQSD